MILIYLFSLTCKFAVLHINQSEIQINIGYSSLNKF